MTYREYLIGQVLNALLSKGWGDSQENLVAHVLDIVDRQIGEVRKRQCQEAINKQHETDEVNPREKQ